MCTFLAAMSEVDELPDLDLVEARDRVLGGPADGLLEGLAAEQVEAAEELLGLHEGPVADNRPAVAHAHRPGLPGVHDRRAGDPDTGLLGLPDPGLAIEPYLGLDRGRLRGTVDAHEQHLLRLGVIDVARDIAGIDQRTQLDRVEPGARMLVCDLDRLLEVTALEQVEAADEYLRVGERTVADQGLAVAHPHGLGVARRRERLARDVDAASGRLLHPGENRGAHHLVLLVRRLVLDTDQLEELHLANLRFGIAFMSRRRTRQRRMDSLSEVGCVGWQSSQEPGQRRPWRAPQACPAAASVARPSGPPRSQTAETSSSSATRNEDPQPQAAITLGLSTLKPAPWRPSTKSITEPSTYGRLARSTSRRMPLSSNTVSSSRCSSKASAYWKPEQPPPRTPTRSPAVSATAACAERNSWTFSAPLSVRVIMLHSV